MSADVLVVAAAILDDLDTPTLLLAARRARPADLAGRWEFPGGKVEAGEAPQAALHRELREELGVQVALGPELVGPENGTWRLTEHFVLRLWSAVVIAGTPAPLVEHDELRWLPLDQWASVPWLDPDLPILHALLAATSRAGTAAW
jgi:8-oxo-dGTP diphosphatase